MLTTIREKLSQAVTDLIAAEKQFRQALPQLAEAAHCAQLKAVFREHSCESADQLARLEHIRRLLRRNGSDDAAQSDGPSSAFSDEEQQVVEDLALASACRRTEHFEMVCYADAVTWATALGREEVAELLRATLREERNADENLRMVSERLSEQLAGGLVAH